MTTGSERPFAVLLVLVLLAVAVPSCDGSDTAAMPDYSGRDAMYSYTVHGSGSAGDPYGSSVMGMSCGPGTVFVQSALEGYPVRAIVSVGGCGADVLVLPGTLEEVSPGAFDGSSVGRLVFLGDRPSGPLPDIPVAALEGTSGWDGADVLPLSVHDAGGSSFSYFVLDGTAVVHRLLSGTDVTVPAGIGGADRLSVGDLSFSDTDVRNVVLPEGTATIGVRAFYGCEHLEEVSLPGTVLTVCDEAFRFCPRLSMPDIGNVSYIGFEAFRQCGSIRSVEIPDSVTYLGDGAFYVCREMSELRLGPGIGSVPARAFGYADSLESVTFASAPSSIGDSAFFGCLSLTSLDCTAAVRIGDSAFSGCRYLADTGELSSVVEMGRNAFRDCRSLESAVLGDGLLSLGQSAYEGCVSLQWVRFEGEMPLIGEYALPEEVAVSCLEGHADSWKDYPGVTVVGEPGKGHTAAVAAVISLLSAAVAVAVLARRR